MNLDNRVVHRMLHDPTYRPMLGELWMRSQFNTFRQVFLMGDTTTIRALLMVASVWQAVSFTFPFGMFEVPFYSEMRFVPGWVWGAAFMLHAALVWWRFRDDRNLQWTGFWVNLYGFCLWTFMCILESMQARPFSASMGMEWTVIAAAFGALVRTGDKNDRTSA